jgi:TrmH family RNA methyltransferase
MLQSLEKSRTRKQLGLAPVEGEKEIEMALTSGAAFQSVFFIRDLANEHLLDQLAEKNPQLELIEIDKDLFGKISYRETTGGVIAVVKTAEHTLASIRLPKNPLVLVIEAVEKPGNLGAILRTADAAAVDAVVCCGIATDLYNPNIIRSSLGTVFTVPLALASNQECMEWLKKHDIRTFCTNLHKATDYHLQDYTGNSAIVMGTEATGISQEWIDFADQNVRIPMLGKIDSMNVSVATAIMVFEAKRQRHFN